jgi:hypothetical protein
VKRLASVALVAAVVVSGGACAKAKAGSGGGEDVSLCAAFKLYDDVTEPSPEDPAAVRRYAQTVVRIYDRVDSHIKVNGHEIPRAVMADVKQIMTSMRHFDAAYARASTRTERVAAEAELVADRKLDRAINAITAYTKDQCVKKSNVPVITTPPETKKK